MLWQWIKMMSNNTPRNVAIDNSVVSSKYYEQ